jgi:hypothetical protein
VILKLLEIIIKVVLYLSLVIIFTCVMFVCLEKYLDWKYPNSNQGQPMLPQLTPLPPQKFFLPMPPNPLPDKFYFVRI